MKALTGCMIVLALALAIPFAAHAAEPGLATPDAQPAVADPHSIRPAQPAVVDAPVVEMLAPSDQPVFSDLQPIEAKNIYCIDSGVTCNWDPDCEGVCDPLVCTCVLHNYMRTCVVCP